MGGIRRRLAESVGALRGVFANPGLRRVELAFAGSAIGNYAFALSLAVYAFHHGGATAVGVVSAVRYSVAGAIAPFAATLSDRFPRRRVMLASDLGRLGSVAAITATVVAGGPRLAVYALAVACSVFSTVFRPAEASLLPTLATSPEELTAANVSSSTFDSLGVFLGPALAALLFALGGATTAFAFVAVTFLWSSLNVTRIPPTPPTPVDEDVPREGIGALVGGFRAIAGEPRLRLLIGLYGAQCVVAGALTVLVVSTALDRLRLGNSGVGLLEAACGVGAVIGAGVTLSLVGRRRLAGDFAFGLVAWGLPLIAIGLVASTAVTVVSLAVLGVGNTIVDITAITLIQRTAAPEVAGRVFGVLEGMLVASLALGAVAAAALISSVGLRATLIVAGAILPSLAVLSWRALQRIDAGAHVPEQQVAALRTVPFLAVLPVQTIEYLAERVVDVRLAAGEQLFRRGDLGDRFYVLREGVLAVELDAGDRLLNAPSYVGEIALLHDVPRTATVRAVEDTLLAALERQDFLAAVTGQARARARADDVIGARLGTAAV